MKKIVLVYAILISGFNCLFAKEKKEAPTLKNNISIQAGSKIVFLKDQLFAPLNFSGNFTNSLGLTFCYRKQKRNNDIFTFNTSLYKSEISSDANNLFKAPMIQINAVISYHTRVSKHNSSNRLYVGPRYDFDVNFVEHSLNAGATAISVLTANSISASLFFQKNIGKRSSLDLEISAPFYGLVYRPPYSVFTDALGEASTASLAFGGKLTGWKNYRTIKSNCKLNLALTKKLYFIASYQFVAQRAHLVKEYALGSHAISGGLTIKY